jgi:flagellar protein FlaF
MSSKKPANPYSAAAGAYDQNARKSVATSPRELEGRVLLRSAQFMIDLQAEWDAVTPELLDKTLTHNRHIWMMFVDNAIEDKSPDRPNSLRNNIANLGAFIFKHTIETLANPQKEKLNILIEINREIAAGLMTTAPGAAAPPPPADAPRTGANHSA